MSSVNISYKTADESATTVMTQSVRHAGMTDGLYKQVQIRTLIKVSMKIKLHKIILFMPCLVSLAFLSGCIATSQEIAGLRDDMHELLLKLNEVQRNQADISSRMDSLSSNIEPLNSQLQETQNRMSLLGQKFDDIETGISQKISKFSENKSQSGSAVSSSSQPPSDIYRLAYSDFSRGRYDVAITGFKSYLEKYPQGELAAQARYYLGECCFSQNNWEKALNEFELVEKNYPKSDSIPPSRLKRGLCLELLKKPKEAREAFHSIVRDYPDSPEAYTAQDKLSTYQTDGK